MSDRQLPQLPPASMLSHEDLFLLHQANDNSSRKLSVQQFQQNLNRSGFYSPPLAA